MPTIETHSLQPFARRAPARHHPSQSGMSWRAVIGLVALALVFGATAGALSGAFVGAWRLESNAVRTVPALAAPGIPAQGPAPESAQAGLPSVAAGPTESELASMREELAALRAQQQRLELGLKLLPGGPPQTEALRKRLAALEAAPAQDDEAQSARNAAARDLRLAVLEQSIADFERLQAAAARQGGVDALGQRLAGVRTGLTQLEQRAATWAPATDLAAARAEIAALRAEVIASRSEAASAGRAARGAFAVAAVAEAAQRSGPFIEAMRALSASFPQDRHVQALAGLANQGAPSRADLLASFAAMDARVDQKLRAQSAGHGLFGQMQAALSQQVSVKSVGPKGVVRTPLDSARALIANGDVAGAVGALDLLTGPAAQEAQAWLDGARRRIEIDARLAAIRAELVKG